jgi:hypothetical protein
MMKRSIVLIPLLAGCYSYTAIPPSSVPAGTEVRARITGAASDRVAPQIGSLDTRELVGNIVENNAGALILQVPMGAMPNVTAGVVPLQTRISLTPADFVKFEQRKLDVGRTSVFTAAVLAGVGVGVAVALRGRGGVEEGTSPPDPPPINRIPIRVWKIAF